MSEAPVEVAPEAPDKKELESNLPNSASENGTCKPLDGSPNLPPSVEVPQQAPGPMNGLQEMLSSPQGLQELLTNPEAAAMKLLGPETIARLEEEKLEQQKQGLANKAALENMAIAIDRRFNELIDHHRCMEGMIAGLQNLILGEKKAMEFIARFEKRVEKKGK